MTSDYLTVAQVAQEFGISRATAYALRRHIQSYRAAGFGVRYRRADVVAWIEGGRRDPVGGAGEPHSSGTRRACVRRQEEIAFGLTRDQLREATDK